MNVRHFVDSDGRMYQISSFEQLTPVELDSVLDFIAGIDPEELEMSGELHLQLGKGVDLPE